MVINASIAVSGFLVTEITIAMVIARGELYKLQVNRTTRSIVIAVCATLTAKKFYHNKF